MTLTNMTFTGFNVNNSENDSILHFKRTVGTVTVTLGGTTSQPSYKSDGATIEFASNSRTVKVITKTGDGTLIGLARVLLRTSADVGGGLPYDDTVTITNSSTTATVTHNGHAMATNDKIQITGASLWQNNGVFQINKINVNSYSYEMSEAPGSDPSGTIKATFVFLEGETDNVTGELSMNRQIPANQNVAGWARKSSGIPFYKQGPLSGSVITSGDTTLTSILSADE